jgi:probable phosphoglycerate mutase
MISEPAALWLLRHAQSEGNVRREEADRSGAEVVDIAERDMDVPLSPLGRRQATAFGVWLGALPDHRQPDAVITSPYRRTVDTALLALAAAGRERDRLHLDERLREREFGILDLLTHRGIEARFPDEAVRRRRLGKFYHRPPGGESWVDVALRVRSLRESLGLEHGGRRVLIVTHEVPIFVMRHLLEEMGEARALALSRDQPVANCGLTTYERDAGGRLALDLVNWTAPLEETATPVTDAPDVPMGPR